MTLLGDLGAWAASARDFPPSALRAARVQLLNMVATAHASALSGATSAVDRALAAVASPGRATALVTGAKLGPIDAAYANAAASMAHDFDDVVWMGHTCHSAVFASLAVAEHEDRDRAELLDAIVVANELGGRLGAACFLGPLNGQMWTFVHLFAAAAATARLLRLDAEQTTHALAIALAQPPFALQPAFLAPTSKLLSASTPTAIGMRAAYLAREGMTGALDILEDKRGFFRRFTYHAMPELMGELGSFWVSDTLQIKTWPGCHYFQTAFDAIEAIRARRPLDPADLRRVTIDTTKLACEATRFARDYVPEGAIEAVNANFDVALSAAILLHAGRLGVRELEPGWLSEHRGAIAALRARIDVRHDPTLSAKVVAVARRVPGAARAVRNIGPRDALTLMRRYREEYASTLVSPREALATIGKLGDAIREATVDADGPIEMWFPSRVTLELADGSIESERVDLPAGALTSSGIDAALARKVDETVGETSGREHARRVLSAVDELRSVRALSEVFRVCARPRTD